MDWLSYLTLLESLPPAGRRVAELVSVEQRFIVRALKGTVNPRQPRQAAQLATHKRFFTALALHELINEAPLRQTAEKFGCNRGALQALQQSAATFAGTCFMVVGGGTRSLSVRVTKGKMLHRLVNASAAFD